MSVRHGSNIVLLVVVVVVEEISDLYFNNLLEIRERERENCVQKRA